jgi:hypothetical protein
MHSKDWPRNKVVFAVTAALAPISVYLLGVAPHVIGKFGWS